jgi:hypothetical protein
MQRSYVWKERTEEELLSCLEEAFRKVGYIHVYNWHKTDRAHEESVDIECQNPQKRVVIQAKIKPAKDDLDQLRKLSHSVANERIYVYVENPSLSFKKEMEALNQQVKFWDSDTLHTFLMQYPSMSYLRFLLLSCELVKDITKSLDEIFSCKDIVPQGLKLLNLKKWWLLKDRAVKLHANMEFLEYFWKEHLFKIDTHDNNEYRRIVEEILVSSKIISGSTSEDLVNIVTEIKNTYPSVFSEYINVVLARTNWADMQYIRHGSYDKKQITRLIENWLVPSPSSSSEYSQIAHYLDNFNQVAEAIEDGIDWLFEDYLQNKGVTL